ncbi:hypothetical protein QQS21_007672 [Conoideocrella luteorostrata]|uniref:Enoyl reductase (ER) domain-containing protein n=1 Tax=Conoideocrella luteorostrata TaxID=1105319 RepID=A0AAJ0CKA8_9HYPO|nr:hypothetical protein QQS21_007672 [Conoideocrella luteorostrata]
MTTMQAINVATYADPSAYRLSEVPRPDVTDPFDVVIHVHASSMNPVDVKKAAGAMKMVLKDSFPYKLGYDAAGVVTEIGSSVTRVNVGDEVYTRLPESHRDRYIARKPKSVSFEEAASLPLAAMTALQALRRYKGGSLSGKTVLVPAGLGGTGSYACQLAKNVFGAGKVITTVSTAKVAKVAELLGDGVVDEILDYTHTDPSTSIPEKSIDFMFDTTGQSMELLSRMVPETGTIVSIATLPSGKQMQDSYLKSSSSGSTKIPFVPGTLLNALDSWHKFRARRWKVHYEYMFLDANGKDLDELREHVDAQKLKPVVGLTVHFEDIEQVKKAALTLFHGKGATGKTVIRMAV